MIWIKIVRLAVSLNRRARKSCMTFSGNCHFPPPWCHHGSVAERARSSRCVICPGCYCSHWSSSTDSAAKTSMYLRSTRLRLGNNEKEPAQEMRSMLRGRVRDSANGFGCVSVYFGCVGLYIPTEPVVRIVVGKWFQWFNDHRVHTDTFMTRDGHRMLILENPNKARALWRSAGKVLEICLTCRFDPYLLSSLLFHISNQSCLFILKLAHLKPYWNKTFR